MTSSSGGSPSSPPPPNSSSAAVACSAKRASSSRTGGSLRSSSSFGMSSVSVLMGDALLKEEESELCEGVVEGKDQGHQDGQRHQHDRRVVDRFLSGWPGDLAQLAPHFSDELSGARPLG